MLSDLHEGRKKNLGNFFPGLGASRVNDVCDFAASISDWVNFLVCGFTVNFFGYLWLLPPICLILVEVIIVRR